MIRVLQVVTRMDRGGLETFIMNVYRKIDREKIQFDFLTHSDIQGAYDEEIKALGGRIYKVRSRRESYTGNLKDLNRFFTEHREYQIVHMHESSMSYVTPLVVAHKHRVKNLILHSRNNNITTSRIFQILHKINRARYSKLITEKYAISKEAAIWMFGLKEYESKKVTVLKNGIEPSVFAFSNSQREILRERFNYSDNDIVIGNVGRLSKQKNQLFLLKVFKKLHSLNMDYKLMIIGSGSELDELKSYIQSNGLTDSVVILENQPDINRYYNVFDLFVLPSLFEGLGRVLLEAQCNGLCCYASKGVIAEEVKVLPSFKFLDLSAESQWIDDILGSDGKRETEAKAYIEKSGYDITATMIYLQNRYIEMSENQNCPLN